MIILNQKNINTEFSLYSFEQAKLNEGNNAFAIIEVKYFEYIMSKVVVLLSV